MKKVKFYTCDDCINYTKQNTDQKPEKCAHCLSPNIHEFKGTL